MALFNPGNEVASLAERKNPIIKDFKKENDYIVNVYFLSEASI